MTVLLGLLLAAAAAAAIYVRTMETTLVINLGIVRYRGIEQATIILCAVLAAIFLLTVFVKRAKKGKQKAEAEKRELERKLAERTASEEAADLSVRKRLDENVIRDLLKKEKDGRWQILSGELDTCIRQLDRMDACQARLAELLKLNDAMSLQDSEEMLDQVEQYLCKNTRKAINYLNILDPESKEDMQDARKRLKDCAAENEDTLKRTQDFLMALADFLNKQGDGSSEMDMLEIYRNTLQDSIRE